MAIPTDYVAYWSLSEASGTAFADASSNAATMNIPSGAFSRTVVSGLGTAVTFNGSGHGTASNYSGTNINYTSPFTVSLNINPSSLSGTPVFFADSLSNIGFELFLDSSTGKLNLNIQDSSSSGICWATSAPAGLSTGTPYSVIVTYDGAGTTSSAAIYVNNSTLSLSNTLNNRTGSTSPNAPFTLADFATGGNAYSGAMKGVRMYTRVVTATERASLAQEFFSTTIVPSNAAIKWNPGAVAFVGGAACCVNPGNGCVTIFSGTSISVTFDVSVNVSPFPQFWARVDDQPFVQYSVAATVAIASGLSNQNHSFELVVKSFDTNQNHFSSPVAIVKLTGIVLDSAATVTAPARRSKTVYVFGDSMTGGFASGGTTSPAINGNDAKGGYAYVLSQALDAEVGMFGFGGTGWVVTGDASTPNVQTTYNQTYSGVPRTLSGVDLFIYLLGYNDGSNNVTSGLVAVVNANKSASPAARHLILIPSSSNNHASEIAAGIATINSPLVTSSTAFASAYNTAYTADGIHLLAFAGMYLTAPPVIAAANTLLYPVGSGRSYSFS